MYPKIFCRTCIFVDVIQISQLGAELALPFFFFCSFLLISCTFMSELFAILLPFVIPLMPSFPSVFIMCLKIQLVRDNFMVADSHMYYLLAIIRKKGLTIKWTTLTNYQKRSSQLKHWEDLVHTDQCNNLLWKCEGLPHQCIKLISPQLNSSFNILGNLYAHINV